MTPKLLRIAVCGGAVFFSAPVHVFAVVGQAERYDEVKQEDLADFHDLIVHEEAAKQLEAADVIQEELKDKKKEQASAEGVQQVVVNQEIESLRRELLNLPKRDRFRLELGGNYQYDSNIQRARLQYEKGDSVFKTNSAALFDLSGRKMDLRSELAGNKEWDIHFPKKDLWAAEERIRYRKKYFKKISHTVHSRIARTSEKTVEIDQKKVRWDSLQFTAFNYAFSRKLSLNNEMNWNHRLFTTEAFDQDSTWETGVSPSGFWHFTPKSRVFLGYTFAANRIHSEVSDTNAHEIHTGYFGKLTNKSSVSLDLAYSRQSPESPAAPEINTVTAGVGYIWQMRPKTQLTVQLHRSQQNTTSDLVQTVTGEQPAKSDSHFVNDSLTFSLNHRLSSRLIGIFTVNGSHIRNKVAKTGDEDVEGRQFLFPISTLLTYHLYRWMQLNLGYTFTYRTGDEKNDKFRSHSLTADVRVIL